MRTKLATIVALAACSSPACGPGEDGSQASREPTQAEATLPQAPGDDGQSHVGCIGIEVDATSTTAKLKNVDGELAAEVRWSPDPSLTMLALAMDADGTESFARLVDRAGATGDNLVDLGQAGELSLAADQVVHLTLHEVDHQGATRSLDTHGFYAFGGQVYTEQQWQEHSLRKLNAEQLASGEPVENIEVTDMGVVDLDAVTNLEDNAVDEGEADE